MAISSRPSIEGVPPESAFVRTAGQVSCAGPAEPEATEPEEAHEAGTAEAEWASYEAGSLEARILHYVWEAARSASEAPVERVWREANEALFAAIGRTGRRFVLNEEIVITPVPQPVKRTQLLGLQVDVDTSEQGACLPCPDSPYVVLGRVSEWVWGASARLTTTPASARSVSYIVPTGTGGWRCREI